MGYNNADFDDLPVRTAPPTVTIRLTPEQRAYVLNLGHVKHDKSERDGRSADWYDGTERDNHGDGVGAELAFCLMTGWQGITQGNWKQKFEFRVDTFKQADVGEDFEIRSTRTRWFALKVKDRDVDSRIAVAFRQTDDQTYVCLGWRLVKEAKKLGEYKDPNSRGKWAYFVQAADLHPIQVLLDAMKKHTHAGCLTEN